MAFMIYNRVDGSLINTGNLFSLAGYNLVFSLWEKGGKPTNSGWYMSADSLIRQQTNGKEDFNSHAFLVDFDPRSRMRIGIIELLDIYAYTYSGESERDASWTPMMLRFRDVLYEEYENPITDSAKEQKISKITEPDNKEDFIEFLYLNGPDKGWNWGRNGMTNAAFIHNPAREYFRQFF